MLEKFKNHLRENFPFIDGKKLLVAVSGGIDSMVLCDLLMRSGCDFSIAHCNFTLRGNESNRDEAFVKSYAAASGKTYHSMRFDTEAFARDNKLSVQVAARQLRYAWFSELLEAHKYDYLLTAHHADDNFETFLINLSRGTGLDGLVGIPAQNGNIVRPMLVFSRKEIEDHAEIHELKWCEDSSNSSDKYLRNQLRHGVVPVLKNLNPNFLESFAQTLSHLQQSQSMAADAAKLVYKEIVVELGGKVLFRIPELKRLENYRAYLYHWLKDFGFTAWDDVYSLIDAQSGKRVFSPEFSLAKDREVLELTPLNTQDETVYTIENPDKDVNFPVKLTFARAADRADHDANSIFVPEEKLTWPLTVRKWREGDWFYPLGMTGKKKLSKFFKDEKYSLADKNAAWLLCSGQDIVWIIGKRLDDRYKVTNTTKNILQIKS